MSNQKTLQLQLDSEHCRAICEEVGERLRYHLRNETTEIPQRLQLLLNRLAELDAAQAASIVPVMDDMILQSAAA